MKIRITMTAEVSDLPAFTSLPAGTDATGAGRQNIWDVMRNLEMDARVRHIDDMACTTGKNEEIHKAVMKSRQADVILTSRLLKDMKMEYVEE